MENVLFAEYVNKFFPRWKEYVETINGSQKAPSYLFKSMLRKEYSADMRWESNTINGTIAAADVVSMDSTLPLKKRDSISTASGLLPKLGIKMKMSEKQISDLNVLIARGTDQAVVVKKVFEDAVKCTNGIDERIEQMFLTALYEGACIVSEDKTTGTGIRADFGFLNANKYGVHALWTANTATPVSDIKKVIDKAAEKGVTIGTICISKATYDKVRNSSEGKQLAANYAGAFAIDVTKLPTPTPSKFNEAFKDETGAEFQVIDRSINIEKNGVQTAYKPFGNDKITFLSDGANVGSLVYGTLAEETNPVENVKYAKANEYCQTKIYHTAEPYAEISAAQALVLPVLSNAGAIYQLDITTVQE